MPVEVPSGVQVSINGSHVQVNGPKGNMERTFSPNIAIKLENGVITVARASDAPDQRALHGTTRAVLYNMIFGVSTGFERILEIDGVGYRAELDGKDLVLHMGYSHPVRIEPPDGIAFDVDTKTRQVFVRGYDKEIVGQIAANIRNVRPPEPFHGKGLHYLGEKIRRKPGKAGKAK
jgi:large subunit ribosomal protein L6